MLNDIGKLSGAAGIGILIGLLLVSYIRPTEVGGVALLIAIPTIICVVVGGILVAIRRRQDKEEPAENVIARSSSDADKT